MGIFQTTPGYYGIFQIIVIPLYSLNVTNVRIFQNVTNVRIFQNVTKYSRVNTQKYLEYFGIFWNNWKVVPNGIVHVLHRK